MCFLIAAMTLTSSFSAFAVGGISYDEGGVLGQVIAMLGGSTAFDAIWGTDHSGNYTSTVPQKYYTTPTESVQDKYGNVTNYYRGGDTTTTKIIDSYNQTFNTIHNTTNNTTSNSYTANVKLSDFLNTYTTNNNNYTYNTDYKSWYYDNTQNTYTYDASQTYYCTDNSRYYVSIDNSTDEYYLIDVQYSPTFVVVNYDYYNVNVDNSVTVGDITVNANEIGDVTNVYYFELTDGRNSYSLTTDEVAGLDLGYDVANYELVTDDPDTLSLQHFDGDYTDSSAYGRTFYSENRSTNYVDTGSFNQGVYLPSGSAAGVTIPNLSSYSNLSFDFRVRYSDIANLGIYLGNTNLFQEVPSLRTWTGRDVYSDNGTSFKGTFDGGTSISNVYVLDYSTAKAMKGKYFTYAQFLTSLHSKSTLNPLSTTISSSMEVPTAFDSSGYVDEDGSTKQYGWVDTSNTPTLYSNNAYADYYVTSSSNAFSEDPLTGDFYYYVKGTIRHYTDKEYRWSPAQYVLANFSYDTYANQWVSMRITISGGKLYYFVNGDLVGSGSFTMPSADKFYIKSAGTVYLDELRVTTGSLSSTSVYTPSSEPYDTNKVLALPSNLTSDTIYVRHSTPVNAWRIGGVRPSNPTTGFLYIPLYDDYTGGQAQFYDGSNWVNVDAVVSDGTSISSVVGYTFTPIGASSDVDSDANPSRPVRPGEDVDPDTCTHDWEETSRTDATCTLAGSVVYTCSICGSSKTESLAKLNHTWEVKQSVQTFYDESGNVVTEGFTIYRCAACGEEYKDTDGSGPPMVDSSDSSDDDGNWFTNLMGKLGDFLGTTVGGLITLIGTVIDKLLDSLITLVSSAFEKLTELVGLFGSFGDAVGFLWSWLPPEIVTVLVAGVTVLIFAAVIKIFL